VPTISSFSPPPTRQAVRPQSPPLLARTRRARRQDDGGLLLLLLLVVVVVMVAAVASEASLACVYRSIHWMRASLGIDVKSAPVSYDIHSTYPSVRAHLFTFY